MNWRWYSRWALDLLYPPVCQLCGDDTSEAESPAGICGACRPKLIDSSTVCPRCGAPAPRFAAVVCLRCLRSAPRFDAVVRLGSYAGALREAVLRTKHPRDEPLTLALARLLAESRRQELAALQIDLVAPVPMHWTRRLVRGVNSPETLARVLAEAMGRPARSRTLRRSRRTQPQYSLSPTERRRNLRRAFTVRGNPKRLAGRRVLLVDDILTTGATANSAAATLKRAGASFVAVAVLSRAPGD